MKKIALGLVFIFIGVVVYSQSWTIEGGPSNDTEFTVITAEQFQRTIQAQEAVARTVTVEYLDYTVFMNSLRSMGTINGTIPTFNGYFCLTTRLIPKNDTGRYFSNITSSILLYGNTRTNSIMIIRFMNIDNVQNALSLRRDWNEYQRQYNQLLRLVNGE